MTTKDLMQRLGLGYRSATELMRSNGSASMRSRLALTWRQAPGWRCSVRSAR